MLPNQRTTRNDVVSAPGETEGLVVASGRNAAKPLVDFLKFEGINVQVASSIETAFEEVLLHRPNVVIIDHQAPGGGIELCARIKANARTHFVPTILSTVEKDTEPLRLQAIAAGADAVFAAGTGIEERRTRLWALLRTQAIYRREEKKRQVQGSTIRERRRWVRSLVHDLQNSIGAIQANFEFLAQERSAASVPASAEVGECVQDCRSLLRDLACGLRTVLEYERFESDRIALNESHLSLGDLAEAAKTKVEGLVGTAGKEVSVESLPNAQLVRGDPEYLKEALANLIVFTLRQPGNRQCRIRVSSAGGLTHASVAGDHDRIPAEIRERVFEPYAQPGKQASLGQGVGLALAKGIITIHGGTVWVEDVPRAGSAFVVELPSCGSPAMLRTV